MAENECRRLHTQKCSPLQAPREGMSTECQPAAETRRYPLSPARPEFGSRATYRNWSQPLRPPPERKVAGSIPAGRIEKALDMDGFRGVWSTFGWSETTSCKEPAKVGLCRLCGPVTLAQLRCPLFERGCGELSVGGHASECFKDDRPGSVRRPILLVDLGTWFITAPSSSQAAFSAAMTFRPARSLASSGSVARS
jgi:hypothetical protein